MPRVTHTCHQTCTYVCQLVHTHNTHGNKRGEEMKVGLFYSQLKEYVKWSSTFLFLNQASGLGWYPEIVFSKAFK